MQDRKSEYIAFLIGRIEELEKENRAMKDMLSSHGLSLMSGNYSHEAASFSDDSDSHIIHPSEITMDHARLFFSYFWGRQDVYAKRFYNVKKDTVGYYTQCNNFWKRGVCPRTEGKAVKCRDCRARSWRKLEPYEIIKHLNGEKPDCSDVIGVYPLFPDGTVRFLVFDFDNHEKKSSDGEHEKDDESWKEEVDAVRRICRINDVPHIVERSRSGRGAHLWIFFRKPVGAPLAREFGSALLDKGAESVSLESFSYYDRMLPAQDELSEGELGNLIALPLQGRALRNGNSAFIDEEWRVFPDQWKALSSTGKIDEKFIRDNIAKWRGPERNKERGLPADGTKPWERKKEFSSFDVDGKVFITLSDDIYIEKANLKPRIQNQIRRLAAFSNPVYFKNRAIGFSNWDESRYIYLGEDEDGYIKIPRGLFDRLVEKLGEASIPYDVRDERSRGRNIDVTFTGKLKSSQEKALSSMSGHDNGILSAATAFGKTILCTALIAEKKVSTLILLESSTLVEQWFEKLTSFLSIKEELPFYKTASGRTKVRKNLIGRIEGSHDSSTGIIDIAMAGSLWKKGQEHPRLSSYGMVIVDECHHSAAETLMRVLRAVKAKYVYGVTATPMRGDGLSRINEMLIGRIRHTYSSKERAEEQGIEHRVYPRFTRTVSPHIKGKSDINGQYEILRSSRSRNEQIENDVRKLLSDGRTPVILTRYTAHAEEFRKRLDDAAEYVFLLTGNKSRKEKESIREDMTAVPRESSMLLIATGQLIGEGFDFPRLDTLIMATPVSGESIVEQYAGRLNRDYEGKNEVLVLDYVDIHIPVFASMYTKRLKAYRKIGYRLWSDKPLNEDPREALPHNGIYGMDDYKKPYVDDLVGADCDIVISSPSLTYEKTDEIIRLLSSPMERGVKVTVVTWDPDTYEYGFDEHRVANMDRLRNNGFHIVYVKEQCQRFAVIDSRKVWFGSIKLLGKEDAEEDIMRIESEEIAEDLLSITFGRKDAPREFSDAVYDDV